MRVSEISLGTWAFGSEWGTVSDEAMDRIREIYDRRVRPEVHHLW